MYNLYKKNYTAPPVDIREVLRYAGCKDDAQMQDLLFQCLQESENALQYLVCYRVLPIEQFYRCISGAKESGSLTKRLCGCQEVVLFAATVGLGLDRLIEKYAKISPSKAVMMQALGAERVESVCDTFCAELQEKYGKITQRFSAGYGDFPLTAQRDIFQVLDCPRQIGLTLNDSLLMTPTKSVTAVVGIGKENQVAYGCAVCDKKDCEMRK